MNPLPNHGTKVLGIAITVIGGLLAEPQIFQALGPWGVAGTVILSGVLTILRGFQNTGNTVEPLPPPQPSVKNGTPKSLLVALALSPLLTLCLHGCATLQSPGAQPYIEAAVDVAVATAESKGIAASKINAIAHQALSADSGTSATLAALSNLINAQIAKLNLPPGDQAAADILEVALSAAIQAKIGDNANIAQTQAAIATVLGYVIADTGG